jgi:hypothetical protein
VTAASKKRSHLFFHQRSNLRAPPSSWEAKSHWLTAGLQWPVEDEDNSTINQMFKNVDASSDLKFELKNHN